MANRRLYPLIECPNVPGYAWTSERWLRRQTYEGRLPCYKVAGKVLVDLDDLDAFIEAGRRDAVA